MKDQLFEIIEHHHKDSVTEKDCISCSSGCCSEGGFAILENVISIFKLYKEGNLKRDGFEFKGGLSLKGFIFEYFDVWERPTDKSGSEEHILMFFHMKSIDGNGHTISIPGDSYWNIRSDLFQRNSWLNKGCVFLSHSVPNWPEDDKKPRSCILHNGDVNILDGAKPIDCIFYTCSTPYNAKTPTSEETDNWFYSIAKAFPNSKQRFKKICETKG